MNYEETRRRIWKALDNLLGVIMNENDVYTGDVTPEQSILWDDLVEKFAQLFSELIEQNNTKR